MKVQDAIPPCSGTGSWLCTISGEQVQLEIQLSAMDYHWAKQQKLSEEWWTKNWPMENRLYMRSLYVESILVHGGISCRMFRRRFCDQRWIIILNTEMRVMNDEPIIDWWKTVYTRVISWGPLRCTGDLLDVMRPNCRIRIRLAHYVKRHFENTKTTFLIQRRN